MLPIMLDSFSPIFNDLKFKLSISNFYICSKPIFKYSNPFYFILFPPKFNFTIFKLFNYEIVFDNI